MNSPAETITPSVHTTGFTLVEEDDVAFSLSLCKEIHRIYGSYQAGELEANDSVHLGLSLTVQVLGTVSGTVTRGMPAMRIEVAAAQAREMMAVMFDEQVTPKAARGSRHPTDRRCSRPAGAAIGLGKSKGTLDGGAVRAGGPDRAGEPVRSGEPVRAIERGQVAGVEEVPAQPPGPPLPADEHSPTEIPEGQNVLIGVRLRRWFLMRSLLVKVLLTAIGCVAAALVVDAPIVMLLLYSNMCMQLIVGYIVLGLWARSSYRGRHRPRSGTRSTVAVA